MIIPTGSIINALAIIIGSLLGNYFKKILSSQLRLMLFQTLGLSIIVMGIDMALKAENFILIILSLIIGGVIGEVLSLEEKFESLSQIFKKIIKSKNKKFTEGFVSASAIFCIGAVTIMAPLNEGLTGDKRLIITKALLDGVISLSLASSLGLGVLFSSIPVLIYQGLITIFSYQLKSFFSTYIINQLTAVGGLLLIGVAINLLKIKKIKVINMLLSMFVVILLSLFF